VAARGSGRRMNAIPILLRAGTLALAAAPAVAAERGAELDAAPVLVGLALAGAAAIWWLVRVGRARRVAGPGAQPWAALSSLREGVLATDADGRIVFLNAAAEE